MADNEKVFTDLHDVLSQQNTLMESIATKIQLIELNPGGGGGGETGGVGEIWYDENNVPKGEIFNTYAGANRNEASDHGSHAEGFKTIASGLYSHAEGYGVRASADYSHSEGNGTKATGTSSHAEGLNTHASGTCSHAEGDNTLAGGGWSHVEGDHSNAYGTYSHAEGYQTNAYQTASHTEGGNTSAYGTYSHAEGFETQTSGDGTNQHAEGWKTTALGNQSHAEGDNTTATGTSSHAEGSSTNTYGKYSHAEGFSTTAYGDNSHTEGNDTTAYGNNSHAGGFGTIASSQNQCVYGKNNIADSASTYVFILGNGESSTNRSNALGVTWTGNLITNGDLSPATNKTGVMNKISPTTAGKVWTSTANGAEWADPQGGGDPSKLIALTQAEYDELTDDEKNNGSWYGIYKPDEPEYSSLQWKVLTESSTTVNLPSDWNELQIVVYEDRFGTSVLFNVCRLAIKTVGTKGFTVGWGSTSNPTYSNVTISEDNATLSEIKINGTSVDGKMAVFYR